MDKLRGLWRGKRIDGSGAWVEGLLEYRDYELSSAQLYNENDCEDFWVDPSTLGECTGLHDRNGKLIFEGDIIRCSRGCPHEVIYVKEHGGIFWGGMPAFYLSGIREGYAWTGSEELIGNIYDTPELLNDKHKENGNDQERAAR